MNGGTRVLVSGMGSELGSLVATLLEKERWVGEVSGLDIDPPRRRLRSAAFHRIEPKDRRKMVEIVRDFDPHVVVHIAVWEPNARAHPGDAAAWTHTAAIGVLGAAAECPSLQHITVRSGISVYGRRRGAATRPDESVTPDPTAPFGRSLLEMEGIAREAGRAADVPVTALRLAPVIGPHVPSPLGRLLRLPAVPVSLLADPAFSVIDDQDAAAAFVAAAARRVDGPVNVVSPGAITASQAVRIGGRLPLPLIGPEWRLARTPHQRLRRADPRAHPRAPPPRAHRRRGPGARDPGRRTAAHDPRGRPGALRVGHRHPPPARRAGRVSPAADLVTLARRQAAGVNEIDPWGMDRDLVGVARSLARLRWKITVGGAENVPTTGGALLVANRRPLGATPLLVAAAIGRATDRNVRFAGIVDIAPIGPTLRRLGGVVARPDEIGGLLRAGHIPAVWCQPRITTSHRVGPAPVPYLAAALDAGVPVLPVAVIAPPLARRVRVDVGPPLRVPRRPGPLAAAELADAIRQAIQRMVDEASPPLWLLPG